MEEALKDIRESELKAKKIIENAEKSKTDMISKARHESLKRLNQETASADREKDEMVRGAAKKLESSKAEAIKKGKSDAEKLGQKARQNLKSAEEFIIKKFEDKISGRQ